MHRSSRMKSAFDGPHHVVKEFLLRKAVPPPRQIQARETLNSYRSLVPSSSVSVMRTPEERRIFETDRKGKKRPRVSESAGFPSPRSSEGPTRHI